MNSRETITHLPLSNPVVLGRRNVYHQAGYAAAIYLGNKERQLPAVHFQLSLLPMQNARYTSKTSHKPMIHCVKLVGGRLIENLPVSFENATQDFSPAQKAAYQDAFEADIINVFTAPLAEAKYIATRDGEVFNPNLVYLGAISFYGERYDLQLINEYIQCLIPRDKNARNRKLTDLFLAAYRFVHDQSNWLAITNLAETIYKHPENRMSCEEIGVVLDLPHRPTINPLFPHVTDSPTTVSAR